MQWGVIKHIMRTPKEIKAEIREVRAEMRARGIRRTSCFNGGLTPQESQYNSRLFALNTELERANGAK